MSQVRDRVSFELLEWLPDSFIVDEGTALRRIDPADAEDFARIISENPDIAKWVTWASQVQSEADVVPVLQAHSNRRMAGRYALTRLEEVVGYVGVFPGEQPRELGMGYFIDQKWRGRGLVKRGVAHILDAALTETGATNVYLQIDPTNTASVAIAGTLGFKPGEEIWDTDLGLNEVRYRLKLDHDETS